MTQTVDKSWSYFIFAHDRYWVLYAYILLRAHLQKYIYILVICRQSCDLVASLWPQAPNFFSSGDQKILAFFIEITEWALWIAQGLLQYFLIQHINGYITSEG